MKLLLEKEILKGKIILISFESCKVTYLSEVLFDPAWGVYDMAIGENVKSAFAGPASTDSFNDIYSVSNKKTSKILRINRLNVLRFFIEYSCYCKCTRVSLVED